MKLKSWKNRLKVNLKIKAFGFTPLFEIKIKKPKSHREWANLFRPQRFNRKLNLQSKFNLFVAGEGRKAKMYFTYIEL